jgi:ESCRT-II complex subunit VPS36
LISPEDLYVACKKLDRLKLPVSLKRFDSGLLAVRSSKFNEEEMSDRLLDRIRKVESANAVQVSEWEHLSVPMALEVLLEAEKRGKICRDDAPLEGLRFHPNRFLEG